MTLATDNEKAFYQVFQDDTRLASRYVAITCRLMIEAGLHQKHVLFQRFAQRSERTKILTILSTCLILDRQLNFNAGLPFTLKDADVDIPEMVRFRREIQCCSQSLNIFRRRSLRI